MKLLPNHFFIGPERTGTTWIHEYLSKRPEVCLPKGTKETFFFDQHYEKLVSWYQWHFDCKNPLIVEVAPTYFKSEKATIRIKNHIPEAKIIATLRNPLDRSISHFNHLLRYGMVKNNFSQAIRTAPEIIDASLYHKHISCWYKMFEGGVSVILYDSLKEDPNMFVREICDALTLNFEAPPEHLKTKQVNPLTYPRNAFIASAGNKVKTFLRSHRLYGVVNFAKKAGLKNFFFGNRSEAIGFPEKSDLLILIELFSKDLKQLSKLAGKDFGKWIIEMNQRIM